MWQYVTLMKRVFLIDSPGVVYDTGDSEAAIVLKGVVRPERLETPEDYVGDILARVKPAHLRATYGISAWADPFDFLAQAGSRQQGAGRERGCGGGREGDFLAQAGSREGVGPRPRAPTPLSPAPPSPQQLAHKTGRLLPGGEADIPLAGRQVLVDWQRGRLPYYAVPPATDAEKRETAAASAAAPPVGSGSGGAEGGAAAAVTVIQAPAQVRCAPLLRPPPHPRRLPPLPSPSPRRSSLGSVHTHCWRRRRRRRTEPSGRSLKAGETAARRMGRRKTKKARKRRGQMRETKRRPHCRCLPVGLGGGREQQQQQQPSLGGSGRALPLPLLALPRRPSTLQESQPLQRHARHASARRQQQQQLRPLQLPGLSLSRAPASTGAQQQGALGGRGRLESGGGMIPPQPLALQASRVVLAAPHLRIVAKRLLPLLLLLLLLGAGRVVAMTRLQSSNSELAPASWAGALTN